MSGAIPHKREDDITEKDLFGSIPRVLDLNPFEGINLDEISVRMVDKPIYDDEWDYIEINPIQGIDIAEMSVVRQDGSDTATEDIEVVEVKPDYSGNWVLIFSGRLLSAVPVDRNFHGMDNFMSFFKK